MTNTGRYHGGLVFFGNPDQALDRFTRIVTATLEDYGQPVERQSILDQTRSRVVANQYLVKLALTDAPDASFGVKVKGKSLQRLELSLYPVTPGQDDKEISELILVVMLYRMVDICTTQVVEWLDPETVLTVEQFLGAFTNIPPRRVREPQDLFGSGDGTSHAADSGNVASSQRHDTISGLPPHDGELGLIDLSEEETLALAYRFCPRPDVIDAPCDKADQAESDIRRLATWGLTGMVAFLSAPVALSMAAVNLARGEDFRLNTHVLSLTGLLVMLQNTGALANAMSYLPL